jgi:hypothetical protein
MPPKNALSPTLAVVNVFPDGGATCTKVVGARGTAVMVAAGLAPMTLLAVTLQVTWTLAASPPVDQL